MHKYITLLFIFLSCSACDLEKETESLFHRAEDSKPIRQAIAILSSKHGLQKELRAADLVSEGFCGSRLSIYDTPAVHFRIDYLKQQQRISSDCSYPQGLWSDTDKRRAHSSALLEKRVCLFDTIGLSLICESASPSKKRLLFLPDPDFNPTNVQDDSLDTLVARFSLISGSEVEDFFAHKTDICSEDPIFDDEEFCNFFSRRLPLYRQNTPYSANPRKKFHDLCQAAQKYIISYVENGTFDHTWLRILLDFGLKFSQLEPRELLAFADSILVDPIEKLDSPSWLTEGKSTRERALIYLEHLKLTSNLLDGNYRLLPLIKRLNHVMGWNFDPTNSLSMGRTALDCAIYELEKALKYRDNLAFFLKCYQSDNMPRDITHLLLKHCSLRHPDQAETLQSLGIELSKYPIALRHSLPGPKHITFIGSTEPIGDFHSPQSMDRLNGKQYPWLSLVLPLIQKLGYTFNVLDWEDSSIDWSRHPNIFIGPVWGWSKKESSFLRFLDRLEELGVKTVNSIGFTRYIAQKTYLTEFYEAGIPTIPSYTPTCVDENNVTYLLGKAKTFWDTNNVIFKGSIGAGGTEYYHYTGNASEAQSFIEKLSLHNAGFIMQPFWPEIGQYGEFSFVFFGNSLSHTFLKIPRHDQELVQVFYGGRSFHYTEDHGRRPSAKVKSDILSFRSDNQMRTLDLIKARYKSHFLWAQIKTFFTQKNIPLPAIARLDCALKEGQLYVMEIEALGPNLEFSAAGEYTDLNQLLRLYVNELLRQQSINHHG